MTPTRISAIRLVKQLACLGSILIVAACTKSDLAQAPVGRPIGPVVRITASEFHFTPDHITLTKGQPVTLEFTSSDTTHGFMLRALNVDTDIKPGKVIDITVTPVAAGTFRAICDHYCGVGHNGMKMTVVIKEPAVANAAPNLVTASAARPPRSN
ncbi:MAG: cupredoxin domain-containing protein [Candidatus Binataceae bacterium]|jgi:cytochrome c oxidase subunit 2